MNYTEAIEYIENFTWSKTRLGLDRTRELLERIGNPHLKLKFIHVAGSNGKGSTCAMLESILRCAGYKTGMYISPFIEDFRETFTVQGECISMEDLCRCTEIVKEAAEMMEDHPSQFEIKTAIAMEYFKDKGVDIVVLEVGMGGEFDSTNVIPSPEVAVITNISLEHTEYLGNTLYEIAYAKAGIIKPGCDVVCYNNKPDVMTVISEVCKINGCNLHRTMRSNIIPEFRSICGQQFIWNNGREEKEYRLSLLGDHQLYNAAVVLKTIDVLRKRGYKISDEAVEMGLASAKWPARFEVLCRDPLFILDGGHNPQCAEAMADIIEEYLPGKKITFIVGILADKDYSTMLDIISKCGAEYICLTPNSPRALSAEDLVKVLQLKKKKAVAAASAEEAVRLALKTERTIVAFGSLYMAGEIRAYARKKFGIK